MDPEDNLDIPDRASQEQEPEHGDLLLVDLLRPDFRHFFSRYRTDLVGLAALIAIVVFIIFATKWLAMIGAGS